MGLVFAFLLPLAGFYLALRLFAHAVRRAPPGPAACALYGAAVLLLALPYRLVAIHRDPPTETTHGGLLLLALGLAVVALVFTLPGKPSRDAGNLARQLHLEKAERQRLEAIRALQAAVIEANDCAIVHTDHDGTIRSWNRGAEVLYGYTEDETLGQSIRLLIPPDRVDEVEAALGRVARGEVIGPLETRRLTKGGEPIEVALTLLPVQDEEGKVIGVSRVLRNLNRHRKVARQLGTTRERLRQSRDDLESIAYVVSHDLKAPLRGLSDLADWLATDYSDRLDEEGRDMLRLLRERAAGLHGLLEGILRYSRAGLQELTLEPVDSKSLVEETVRALAVPPGVDVHLEGSLPEVVYDRTQLRQVFQNLLDNALSHLGKESGEVVVGCKASKGTWVFHVRDTGPGIPRGQWDRIFELFRTLSGGTRQGSGVGLALVRRIVRRHGGEVWLDSPPGCGTTFYFSVPRP